MLSLGQLIIETTVVVVVVLACEKTKEVPTTTNRAPPIISPECNCPLPDGSKHLDPNPRYPDQKLHPLREFAVLNVTSQSQCELIYECLYISSDKKWGLTFYDEHGLISGINLPIAEYKNGQAEMMGSIFCNTQDRKFYKAIGSDRKFLRNVVTYISCHGSA